MTPDASLTDFLLKSRDKEPKPAASVETIVLHGKARKGFVVFGRCVAES